WLRGRRTASRPAAPALTLDDEAARPRGGGAAYPGAWARRYGAAPDHGRRRRGGHPDVAFGQDAHARADGDDAGRMALDRRSQRAWLWRANDSKLAALANVGPANPREFTEVTSTPDIVAPLVNATGGTVARVEDGSGVRVPRLLGVRGDTFHGD